MDLGFLHLAHFLALSRIYVGVHYPIDILTGAFVGFVSANIFYGLYVKFIVPGLMLDHHE